MSTLSTKKKMSEIRLKITDKVGISAPSEDLPQDGQRLVSVMEDTFKERALAACGKAAWDFINQDFLDGLVFSIMDHLFRTGKFPKYHAYRSLMSHDYEQHERNYEHINRWARLAGFPEGDDILREKKFNAFKKLRDI